MILIKTPTVSPIPLSDATKPLVVVHRDAPGLVEPCHIVLSCRSALPEPTEIVWLKDGLPIEHIAKPLNKSSGRYPAIVEVDSRLIFKQPGAAEDGVYACTVRNRQSGSLQSVAVSGHNFTMTASKRAPAGCLAVREAHAKRLAARAKRGGRAAALEHAVLHEVQARENEPAWLACEVGGGSGKKKQQQQQHLHGVVGHSVKWLKDGKLLRHSELLGAHETAQTTEATVSENGRPREDCKFDMNGFYWQFFINPKTLATSSPHHRQSA